MGPQVDWALSALDAGSVQGIDFSGIEHLQGGEGDDRFILVDGAWFSGWLGGLRGGDTGLVKVRALSRGGSSGGVFGNASSLLFGSSNITAVGAFVYSEILGLTEAYLDSCGLRSMKATATWLSKPAAARPCWRR
ncbi:hypothetical protein [Marinobacterium rhizophilum]|uniref:hypothetical protein n=1 Tax=Marinobacterium rhizophilum TaxID=420402 RepID=UPI0003763A4F|nr:hypothetical protein [Marinobacterium rhizophilum]